MVWNVQWSSSAEDELMRIYELVDIQERPQVTDAANRIDIALRRRPLEAGFQIDGRFRRVLIDDKIGVRYHVFEQDMSVKVLQCWYVIQA